jgi:hypothetical protein
MMSSYIQGRRAPQSYSQFCWEKEEPAALEYTNSSWLNVKKTVTLSTSIHSFFLLSFSRYFPSLVINMGPKKQRNQSRRNPSNPSDASAPQPCTPTSHNDKPASRTPFTPVNTPSLPSLPVPQPYRHQPQNTAPYSQAEWEPSRINPSLRNPHPNFNSPLTLGGFGNAPSQNSLNPAGGTEYGNTPSSIPQNATWICDANVKSLTDAYSKLGLNMQQGNDLTFEVPTYLLPR